MQSVRPGCGDGDDHNAQDVTFAQNMIPHHQQAIEMSDMALAQASSPEVKDLATRIKAAQEPEIRQMRGWLSDWGQEQPPIGGIGGMGGMGGDMHVGAGGHGMGMMSADDMRALHNASGSQFDRMFLTMMIAHHNGAIEMARQEVDEGEHEPARKLAASIRDSQQAEIREMNDLLSSLPAA